jgi:hypothetical protein
MSSGLPTTMFRHMGGGSRIPDPTSSRRALDRLAEHCELSAKRAAAIEERRAQVHARLEHELGPEFARTLLAGLASAA